MNAVFEVIKKVNRLCAGLAGLILLFVTFSIFVDVALRYFFGRPSVWITEVSTYLFLYIIFLGTSYALQEGMHIRVTFLLDLFGPTVVRYIELVTSIFATIFALVLLWQTSLMTWVSFKEKWTSPTMLSAPYAYIYVVMVLGALMLALTFIFGLILKFKTGPDRT